MRRIAKPATIAALVLATISGTISTTPVSAGNITAATPGAVGTITATPGPGQATIEWTAPAGKTPVTGYTISYSTTAVGPWTTALSVGANQLSTTLLNLKNGTQYWVRVAGSNINGVGTPASTSVTPVSPASPVLGLTLVGVDGAVELTWDTPADNGGALITDYQIQYTSDGFFWATWEHQPSTLTSATISGLSNGTLYDFAVAAVNRAGVGATDPVAATPHTTAGAVGALKATGIKNGLTLTWTAPVVDGGAGVTDYQIRYSADNKKWTTFEHTATSQTGATISGLKPGGRYTIKVAPINWGGVGTEAATSGTVYNVPGAPRTLALAANNGSIKATWTAPASNGGSTINGYAIFWSKTATGPWTGAALVPAGTLSATVKGLTNGTTYHIKVVAANDVGQSAGATGSSKPAWKPTAVKIATLKVTKNAVTATWAASGTNGSAIKAYGMNWRKTGSSTWSSRMISPLDRSATFPGLAAGTSYEFQLVALNGIGITKSATMTARTLPTGLIP